MEIIELMAALTSNTAVAAVETDITFVVRNTKNGIFRFSKRDIVDMLRAVEENIDEFAAAGTYYNQERWRDLIAKHFNGIAKTSAGNQTKLTFNLLAKVIHVCCNPLGSYRDDHISLSLSNVSKSITALENREPENAIAAVMEDDEDGEKRLTGGENVLLTGAPGTGKSHEAQKLAGRCDKAFFCSFSQDTHNADFFGNVRSRESEKGDATVFAFEPGVFIRAYAHALKHPLQRVALVIDEINRGNVGAIFGDLFTMLDRLESGRGRYPCATGNNGVRKWLEQETGLNCEELRLPSNLFIYATMNGSDQSVANLDTAFVRRWNMRNVKIEYDHAPAVAISIPAGKARRIDVPYSTLLRTLNFFIVDQMQQPEDRRLGPFFIPPHQVEDGGDIPETLIGYLWGLKQRSRGQSMFRDTIKSRDDLDHAREAGTAYLTKSLLEQLGAQEGGDED
jgi:hypothetical protein